MKRRGKRIKASYADMYKDFERKDLVSSKVFKNIITVFNLLLIESITKTGHTYKFPFGLGNIGVYKYPRPNNKAAINWSNPVEGKATNYLSRHSEGYLVRWYWSKKKAFGANFPNTSLWRMRMRKTARKTLSQEVIENNAIKNYFYYYDQRTIYIN